MTEVRAGLKDGLLCYCRPDTKMLLLHVLPSTDKAETWLSDPLTRQLRSPRIKEFDIVKCWRDRQHYAHKSFLPLKWLRAGQQTWGDCHQVCHQTMMYFWVTKVQYLIFVGCHN